MSMSHNAEMGSNWLETRSPIARSPHSLNLCFSQELRHREVASSLKVNTRGTLVQHRSLGRCRRSRPQPSESRSTFSNPPKLRGNSCLTPQSRCSLCNKHLHSGSLQRSEQQSLQADAKQHRARVASTLDRSKPHPSNERFETSLRHKSEQPGCGLRVLQEYTSQFNSFNTNRQQWQRPQRSR